MLRISQGIHISKHQVVHANIYTYILIYMCCMLLRYIYTHICMYIHLHMYISSSYYCEQKRGDLDTHTEKTI
jgi:hypothetical protein